MKINGWTTTISVAARQGWLPQPSFSGLWLCALIGLASCSQSPRLLATASSVSLSVPDSVRAGQPVALQLTVQPLPTNEPVWLISETGWGTRSLPLNVTATKTTISLPTAWTTRSGKQELRVVYGGKTLAHRPVEVLPGLPGSTLPTYLGSKSIVADGHHWAMITAIPTDSLTNPVAAGIPVSFRAMRPNGALQTDEVTTRHLVAYHRLTAQTHLGKTIVGVQAGTVRSKEKELLEVPDFPTPFSIHTAVYTPLPDGRQTFRIRTSTLVDQHANVVSEGTLVVFRCTDPDGHVRLIRGYTLRGVAEVIVENPSGAGKFIVQASVFGSAQSQPLTLSFPELPTQLTVQVEAGRLRIGPVTEELGQYMPDGTPVHVTIDQQPTYTIELLSGYADIDRRPIEPGLHVLHVVVGSQSRDWVIQLH